MRSVKFIFYANRQHVKDELMIWMWNIELIFGNQCHMLLFLYGLEREQFMLTLRLQKTTCFVVMNHLLGCRFLEASSCKKGPS